MSMIQKLSARAIGCAVLSLVLVLSLAHMAPLASAQPADTLRVGHWGFPAGLGNPYSGVPGVPQIYVWSAVFDTLTYVDEQGNPIAGLAGSWKNVDPTTWQFSMRPGVMFQNGEPVDANAVAKAIEWLGTDAGKATTVGRTFKYVNSAKVLDAMTVEITTSDPRPIFPNQMSALYVVPPRAWEDMGVEAFAREPIGSGSYHATSWSAEAITMEGFAGSWRAPKIQKLNFSNLSDPAARLQALVSNQIDIMIQITGDQFDVIKSAGGTVDVAPSPLLLQLAFVLENAKEGVDISPLKDLRVRKALNYAVNKQAINDGLMGGNMEINSQYSLPIAFGYNPDIKPFAYDPEKAKALLAEAGYPNGFKMVAEIRNFPDVFQQVALDLSRVGVELELRRVVPPDWIKKFLSVQWEGQAFSLTLGVAPELDTNRMQLFQSCRKNPPYYCNREIMALVEAADSEFDPAKRKAILHEMLVKLTEDAPAIFIFEQKDLNAYGKRVRGFRNINRNLNYHEITLVN